MLAQLILLEWQVALLDILVGRSALQRASVDGFWNISLRIQSALDNVTIWVTYQWVAEPLSLSARLVC